jgi:hypothetical protein
MSKKHKITYEGEQDKFTIHISPDRRAEFKNNGNGLYFYKPEYKIDHPQELHERLENMGKSAKLLREQASHLQEGESNTKKTDYSNNSSGMYRYKPTYKNPRQVHEKLQQKIYGLYDREPARSLREPANLLQQQAQTRQIANLEDGKSNPMTALDNVKTGIKMHTPKKWNKPRMHGALNMC